MVMNMFKPSLANKAKLAGFVLIEALIALLIVSLGILALSKLEALTLSAAGESRSRSEAVTLAQRRMEQLRQTAFTAPLTTTTSQTCDGAVTLGNGSYTLCWTITDASADRRLIQLSVQWTDRFGTTQTLTLSSAVAWDDPELQVVNSQGGASGSLISPTGDAQRGDLTLYRNEDGTPQGTATNDGQGTHLYTDGDRTLLLNSEGQVVLYLENNAQFTKISGRIYFDQNAGNNAIPESDDVIVRLSSEGECFYDNANQDLVGPISAGSNSYKYFEYVCYVGPGWYGNVGITIKDAVNGQAATPTICVGDPGFNNGVSNSTLTSAHPLESGYRSYRGFYSTGTVYLSNGVAGNRSYPNDGTIIPGTYANGANGQYNQHFLITRLSGNNASCYAKMAGGTFASNAGKYYCISPDKDATHDDVCPSVWPGFASEVGTGGSINYTLTLTKSGSGTGSVVSDPTGVSCDTGCTATSGSFANGTMITLTPMAVTGSTFGGWGGACSGTGTCTVTLSANTSVTATFNTGTTTYTLTVGTTGPGSVTSTDTHISCPGTCTYDYLSGSNVSLTATPSAGYTFTGWGGACSGTSTCSVSMNAIKDVTATFALNPTPYTLSLSKSSQAGGTVSSSPSGINCGTTCASASSSYAAGTVVTLSAGAANGYEFTGWSGACSGTGTCVVTMSAAQSVTANFGALCNTPISGTAHDKHGTVSVSPSSAGSCSMANSSANYSCSLSTVSGTAVTLTNTRTSGNTSDQYSYTMGVTANCVAQTNVNFP